jgi:uncharacterized membrane protein
MGIGASVIIMAVGAILTFAVEAGSAEGFNINTIGIILMIAGALGLLMTLLIWGPRNRTRVVEDRRTVV